MKKELLIAIPMAVVSVPASAQTTIFGDVKNIDGHHIEYVSLRVDSQYTISDKDGNFVLRIPEGHRSDLVVSHLSYKTQTIPYAQYRSGSLHVRLEEKVQTIGDVTIAAPRAKIVKVGRQGMKMPGDAAFTTNPEDGGNHFYDYELGPVIKPGKNYLLRQFSLHIDKCTYQSCVLRLTAYEVCGGNIAPVQHRPIYIHCGKDHQNTDYTQRFLDNIVFKKGHTYYIGIALVSAEGAGSISFPACLHRGYAHKLDTGRIKKLPASLALNLSGIVVKEQALPGRSDRVPNSR